MSTEMRRSLFAAVFAGAALVGCGGGGNGGSSSGGGAGAPAPAPPPAPPPAGGGSYFLTGHAAGNFGGASIGFLDSPVASDPYALYSADPASLATPPVQQVPESVAVDLPSVSEWFTDGNGNATAWGVRYRLYFDNRDNLLHKIDLRQASPVVTPAQAQLSSISVMGGGSQPQLCWFGALLFDDYHQAANSWLMFHAKGPDANCGSADDQFVAVQMQWDKTVAPALLKQVEPVEALRDATGAVTGFLAVNHPAVDANVQPTSPPQLQQLDTGFAMKTTFSQTLVGKGVTSSSGDFHSLGVSPGKVWVYADTSDIWTVNLASGVSTKVFTIGAQDQFHGRAVFDGSTAYVAIDNSSTGDYVVAVNLSNNSAVAGAANGMLGIELVGTTSTNLVYLYSDHSALKAVPKANVAAPAISLVTLSGTQTIDAPLGATGGTAPVAYLVGDGVFFTVADSSNGSKQAYYANGASNVSVAGTVLSTGAGAVIGTVAGTFSAAGPVVNSGALVLSGGVFNPALSFSAATLSNYSAAGGSPILIGTLPTTTNPISAVAISAGPLQAGRPAMLEMAGFSNGIQANADDIASFTPDAASSFQRLTTNMN